MRIQLMGTDDPSNGTAENHGAQWKGYVDSYTLRQPTEWLPKECTPGQVHLRRWVFREGCPKIVADISRALRDSGKTVREGGVTRIRIASDYKILFESGSETVFYRKSLDTDLLQRAKAKREERERRMVSLFCSHIV